MSVDFFASASWMVYGGKFVPHHFVFTSVYDHTIQFSVVAKQMYFSYEEVAKNLSLPRNPFTEQPHDVSFTAAIDTLPSYIKDDFFPNIINTDDSSWSTTRVVGCFDTATFHYLAAILPEVRLLDPNVLGDKMHLLAPNSDQVSLGRAASDKLFILRQKSNDRYWEV